MTMTSAFSDPKLVAQASRKNILEDPATFTLKEICVQQVFFNTFRSGTDVVSLSWAQEKAECITISPFLLVLKQTYDALPKSVQGGFTNWKVLADKLAYQAPHRLYHQVLSTQHRWGRCGIVASCFKAAAKLLDAADRPSKLLQYFLWGVVDCSDQEFKGTTFLNC